MWGDPEGAMLLLRSSAADPHHLLQDQHPQLHSLLTQISGPGHVPRDDLRWSDLFHHYNILVHVEEDFHHPSSSMLTKACHEMTKHCGHSSNLAALALHASRMIRDLEFSCWDVGWNKAKSEDAFFLNNPEEEENDERSRFSPLFGGSSQHSTPTIHKIQQPSTTTMNASSTIALVGKARVTAGVLNVLRVFIHPIMVHASQSVESKPSSEYSSTSSFSCVQYLQDAFTYKSREHSYAFHPPSSSSSSLQNKKNVDAATELISAVLSFLSMAGNGKTCFIPSRTQVHNHLHVVCKHVADLAVSLPELYDVTIQCFNLLFILTSSQLYQPMISSTQWFLHHPHPTVPPSHHTMKQDGYHFFLDIIMRLAGSRSHPPPPNTATTTTFHEIVDETVQNQSIQDIVFKSLNQQWSAQSILSACLNWFLYRPAPPSRSISAHHSDLVSSVAQEIHSKMGSTTATTTALSSGTDGIYDTTHTMVRACIPSKNSTLSPKRSTSNPSMMLYKSPSGLLQDSSESRHASNTKKSSLHSSILDLSSSLLLLPIRLIKLALNVFLRHPNQLFLLPFGHSRSSNSSSSSSLDLEKILSLKSAISTGHLDDHPITNDVLWMSDSILADFACAFFLLVTNNYRASAGVDESALDRMNTTTSMEGRVLYQGNPFRSILSVLDDHRWETVLNGGNPVDSRLFCVSPQSKTLFTIDFELLFQRFTSVVHNEMGSLALYTLFMSSPIVMTSFLVRSDLDALVVPLLRTLYMSMTLSHHYSGRTTLVQSPNTEANVESASTSVHVLERPFRSSSQLYVLLIILLIFSQDSSFGPDSFRRTSIASVPWYKERSLKDISLGSLLILTLLRCITFNINRLQDPFLLSNACAILLNLSPHMYNLHPYCAMRLASVTVSSMKKYAVLYVKKGGREAEHAEEDTILGMHAEISQCLMHTVRNGLRSINIESNLHLVYSLVYLQRDFNLVAKAARSPFTPTDIEPIQRVISRAYEIIRNGSSRSADEALTLLRDSIQLLRSFNENNGEGSVDSDEDFAFTYEEESDPEIFFLPYVWEVIVCVVSSSILEWDKQSIKIFPLLSGVSSKENEMEFPTRAPAQTDSSQHVISAKDATELV